MCVKMQEGGLTQVGRSGETNLRVRSNKASSWCQAPGVGTRRWGSCGSKVKRTKGGNCESKCLIGRGVAGVRTVDFWAIIGGGETCGLVLRNKARGEEINYMWR